MLCDSNRDQTRLSVKLPSFSGLPVKWLAIS